MKEKMLKALNRQVREELDSAYLYLSMSAYMESVNLKGFANWLRVQTQEEISHAMKIYDFILERGDRVELDNLQKPQYDWDSPLAAFEAAYKHEVYISGLINDLVKLSFEESDFAAHTFLQWFVTEQVEEEASADEVVQNLKMTDNSKGALYMLDRELGSRVFTPPAVE